MDSMKVSTIELVSIQQQVLFSVETSEIVVLGWAKWDPVIELDYRSLCTVKIDRLQSASDNRTITHPAANALVLELQMFSLPTLCNQLF